MEGLTEGRMVHFVLPDGNNTGEHRPAIVVKVCRNGFDNPAENGHSNLQVFTDSLNDGTQYAGRTLRLFRPTGTSTTRR